MTELELTTLITNYITILNADLNLEFKDGLLKRLETHCKTLQQQCLSYNNPLLSDEVMRSLKYQLNKLKDNSKFAHFKSELSKYADFTFVNPSQDEIVAELTLKQPTLFGVKYISISYSPYLKGEYYHLYINSKKRISTYNLEDITSWLKDSITDIKSNYKFIEFRQLLTKYNFIITEEKDKIYGVLRAIIPNPPHLKGLDIFVSYKPSNLGAYYHITVDNNHVVESYNLQDIINWLNEVFKR